MELSMRDWLFIIGGVLILLILADGFRRMWRARRSSIRVKLEELGASIDDPDEIDLLRGELPSGGARLKPGSVDAIESQQPVAKSAPEPEPTDELKALRRHVTQMTQQQFMFEDESRTAATEEHREPVEIEVLAIHLLAPEPIDGQRLLSLLQQQRLEFGERSIFHCYKRSGGKRDLLFSVANLLEPGTFDPEQADQLETLGLILFMTLPGPLRPLDAFDEMRRMAEVLRRALGGELRNSAQEPFTGQAVRAYRELIRRFVEKPPATQLINER